MKYPTLLLFSLLITTDLHPLQYKTNSNHQTNNHQLQQQTSDQTINSNIHGQQLASSFQQYPNRPSRYDRLTINYHEIYVTVNRTNQPPNQPHNQYIRKCKMVYLPIVHNLHQKHKYQYKVQSYSQYQHKVMGYVHTSRKQRPRFMQITRMFQGHKYIIKYKSIYICTQDNIPGSFIRVGNQISDSYKLIQQFANLNSQLKYILQKKLSKNFVKKTIRSISKIQKVKNSRYRNIKAIINHISINHVLSHKSISDQVTKTIQTGYDDMKTDDQKDIAENLTKHLISHHIEKTVNDFLDECDKQ